MTTSIFRKSFIGLKYNSPESCKVLMCSFSPNLISASIFILSGYKKRHQFSFKNPLTLPNTSLGQALKGGSEPPKRANSPLGVRGNHGRVLIKQRVFLEALITPATVYTPASIDNSSPDLRTQDHPSF